MFPQNVKGSLKNEFTKLIEPVKLILRKGNTKIDESTELLLNEISSVSDKIRVVVSGELECHGYPCISIETESKDYGLRYMGKPDGGEFQTFINAIIMVSRNEYDLSDRTVEFVEEIDQHVDIKVFVTSSCGWCPPAILKAYSFAMVNDNIKATAIDCYAFEDLAIKYNVAAVPKIVINDKVEMIGLKDENEFLGHIFSSIT